MSLPGFTALASVYRSSYNYRSSGQNAGTISLPVSGTSLPNEGSSIGIILGPIDTTPPPCDYSAVQNCQDGLLSALAACAAGRPGSRSSECAAIRQAYEACASQRCSSSRVCTKDIFNGAASNAAYCCPKNWVACDGTCQPECSPYSGAQFNTQTCTCQCGNPSEVVCQDPEVLGADYCTDLRTDLDCGSCGNMCSGGKHALMLSMEWSASVLRICQHGAAFA